MGNKRIVCMENVRRYYGAKPGEIERYEAIERSGICCFCAPNIKNVFVDETDHWNVVECNPPYKGTRLHLLLLPKRHVICPEEMMPEELGDMINAINIAVIKNPFLSDGYGLALRVKKVGGVSLFHSHWHLFGLEIGPAGQIPLQFGIG